MSDNNHLVKLKIHSFPNRDYSGAETVFTLPVNPESFTKNYKVDLDERRGHGNNGTDVRFKSTAPEELRLEFILDGTGTIEGYLDALKTMPVTQQLETFMRCVYNMDSNIHRPRFLLLIWGSDIKFRCVLSNLDINHTLFTPKGDPLRVKLNATFLNYVARQERQARDRTSSPDLTHYRKVVQGDRLDNMTNTIYNDPAYLMQVAKVNGLSTIRSIKAGTELYFPPFDQTEK